MIINDDRPYDSMSDDEMEALEHVAMHRQVNEDEDHQVFCDNDSSPNLVVSKVLTLQHQQHDDHRCHIFHTKAGINGRSVMVIIDGGSCHNLASEELCDKLQLVKTKHPLIEAKVSRLSMRWWLSFWRKSTLTIRLRTCEDVAP